MYSKKIVLMMIVILIILLGCEGYPKNYIENTEIKFHNSKEDTTEFTDYYIEIANEYYSMSNYNSIDLYRHDDSAIVVFDFNDEACFLDISKGGRFFIDLFIDRHGNPLVAIGKMGGFYSKVYDDDYKFWKDAYLICKVNNQIIYQAYYEMNNAERLSLADEYLSPTNSELFEIKKSQIERFKNLSSLDDIGKCTYSRNIFSSRLYIDILNDQSLSEEVLQDMIDTVITTFSNLDDELMFYYNGSYSKITIRFKDDIGVYHEINLISNMSEGFDIVD